MHEELSSVCTAILDRQAACEHERGACNSGTPVALLDSLEVLKTLTVQLYVTFARDAAPQISHPPSRPDSELW